MARILSTDEMLDLAFQLGLDGAARIAKATLEALATELAAHIAAHLDIVARAATYEGTELGGTCAPFYAKFKGQQMPDALNEFDTGGEWEVEP